MLQPDEATMRDLDNSGHDIGHHVAQIRRPRDTAADSVSTPTSITNINLYLSINTSRLSRIQELKQYLRLCTQAKPTNQDNEQLNEQRDNNHFPLLEEL